MSEYVDHGWRHRPFSQGGTDPVPIDTLYIVARTTGNVTAGEHATGDNYALPFHDDYSTSAGTNGGFTVNGVGGIVLPSIGLYHVQTDAFIGDSDFSTKNFQLGHTFTPDGQTFNDVIGSNNLGGETLFDSMSHDGTSLVGSTVDRQKPEMQLINYAWLRTAGDVPYTIWPTYYSYTASETTNWNMFQTVVTLVSATAPTFL